MDQCPWCLAKQTEFQWEDPDKPDRWMAKHECGSVSYSDPAYADERGGEVQCKEPRLPSEHNFVIYLRREGLGRSGFPGSVPCVNCGADAEVMFVVMEGAGDGAYVRDQRPADAKYWPHDACAVANYFCTGCGHVTAEFNQA